MRIAVVTLPLHTNYGGLLQAFALKNVLEGMGHSVTVLDLKDKISFEDLETFADQGAAQPAGRAAAAGAASEAVEALVQLGYSLSEAGRAVRAVEGAEQMDSEQILKAALKQFRF